MQPAAGCPECGAPQDEGTCLDRFHRMLAWESEDPALGVVHHLMVLCYHLQHPSLYSPEGLRFARGLLKDFVEGGVSPQKARERHRTGLDSHNRNWSIKGTPAHHGSYDPPLRWPMTAADVIAGGKEGYCDLVRAWAQSAHETFQAGPRPQNG
jgi:hypothetical protein